MRTSGRETPYRALQRGFDKIGKAHPFLRSRSREPNLLGLAKSLFRIVDQNTHDFATRNKLTVIFVFRLIVNAKLRAAKLFVTLTQMQGSEIRQWREKKGLTRKQLGEVCNVSASTVANWELNRNQPHGAAAECLKKLLSSEIAVIPLTPQEERILDELVKRSGFASRKDYLTAQLIRSIEAGDLG